MSEPGSIASTQRKSEQKAPKTRRRLSPLAAVLGAATLIGGLAALLTLLPRMTAAASDPVNPEDPFSSSITISNTGYIPLDSVSPSVAFGAISFNQPLTPLPENRHYTYGSRIHLKEWGVHDLGLDDKFTIAINQLFAFKNVKGADIGVIVDYEIPIVHIKRRKTFPMVLQRQTDGHLYWYSKTPY